jgi:hypothetical protein
MSYPQEMSLCDANFDSNMNLVNTPAANGKTVVLFSRPGCPHCEHMKDEYKGAVGLAPDVNFKVVNTGECSGVRAAASGPTSPFKVNGVPKIVGYLNGKYFSTYVRNENAPPENLKNFRRASDLALFGQTIGTIAPVQHQSA